MRREWRVTGVSSGWRQCSSIRSTPELALDDVDALRSAGWADVLVEFRDVSEWIPADVDEAPEACPRCGRDGGLWLNAVPSTIGGCALCGWRGSRDEMRRAAARETGDV